MVGLDEVYRDVRDFHYAFGLGVSLVPTLQPKTAALNRAAWIDEEAQELRDATTVKDQADAYIDVIYFAMGGLVELGVFPQKLFDAVHKANMGKIWPDGKVHIRETDGKILKPPGWTSPDAAQELEIQKQIEAVS